MIGDDQAFLNNYNILINRVRQAILLYAESNLDFALRLSFLYGSMRWFNYSGVYSDESLEVFLTLKVEGYLIKTLERISKYEKNEVVLLASEIYDKFGHSAVVDKWLYVMAKERRHKLVLSFNIQPLVKEKISSYGVVVHKCSSHGVKLIEEILLASANASIVVLHIHPSDIYACIASRLLKRIGIRVDFYGHAEHAFSFGMTGADVVHELGLYGMKINNKSHRVLGKRSFLGIPIDIMPVREIKKSRLHIEADKKLVISSGSAYKYQPDSLVSFASFLDQLLDKRKDIVYCCIGLSGQEDWLSPIIDKYKERVICIAPLPYEEYVNLIKQAKVLVDTFPQPGGTSFAEALIYGLSIAGLNYAIQGVPMPAESLRVNSINELVNFIAKLLDNDPEALNLQDQVRQKTLQEFGLDAFYAKIKDVYEAKFTSYQFENDARSFFVEDNYAEKQWLINKTIKYPKEMQDILNLIVY